MHSSKMKSTAFLIITKSNAWFEASALFCTLILISFSFCKNDELCCFILYPFIQVFEL